MFTLNVDRDTQLHLLQIQDSVSLFQLVQENREHLRQWLPWIDNIISPIQYHGIISG